jgi:hypothetical protein
MVLISEVLHRLDEGSVRTFTLTTAKVSVGTAQSLPEAILPRKAGAPTALEETHTICHLHEAPLKHSNV